VNFIKKPVWIYGIKNRCWKFKNNKRTTDRRKNIMVTISIGGTLVKEGDYK
jgi:hypothetical protein